MFHVTGHINQTRISMNLRTGNMGTRRSPKKPRVTSKVSLSFHPYAFRSILSVDQERESFLTKPARMLAECIVRKE